MERKRLVLILGLVLVLLAAAAGLVTWLVLRLMSRLSSSYDTIHLEGPGLGEAGGSAAYVRFRSGAHALRWFVPTTAATQAPESRPLVLWLDGVVAPPPSLLANLGIVGPYDYNLERRNDSWINDYNLLFVDAPVGSGFSFIEEESQAASSLQENSEDLLRTLHSFYEEHEGRYADTPLYLLGQGFGAQMATHLALLLQEYIDRGEIHCNLQGVVLGNPIVSPALVTSQLGLYLEELGYVDDRGRSAMDALAQGTLQLVGEGRYEEAFSVWAGLEAAVEETAGAVAVNLHRIVDKMTRESSVTSHASMRARRLRSPLPATLDVAALMDGAVGPALGVASGVAYDSQSDAAVAALLSDFMRPAHDNIEEILQNTALDVWIYNGNLDAISNTPGQLLWIESLEWEGAEAWAASERQPLAVAGTLEGYVRSSGRLHLYWMNVAGHSVPSDSPAATREVLRRITGF